jgi:hypothetical protein
VKMRDKMVAVARDNVIFELGLFIGRLGRNRVFFIAPRGSYDFHLPTDLLGVTSGDYDHTRSDQRWESALAPACNKIRRSMANFTRATPLTHQEALDSIVEQLKHLISMHLETEYIGEFPSYLDKITDCLRQATNTILIACDVPTYASFSNYRAHMNYFATLAEVKSAGIAIKILTPVEERRRIECYTQFARTAEQWSQLKKDPEFVKNLKALELRRGGVGIDSPDALVDALLSTHTTALRQLREDIAASVHELDMPFPIHVWIADDKRAVFTVPDHGSNSSEYGFQTKDPNFVKAITSIWQRYESNKTA